MITNQDFINDMLALQDKIDSLVNEHLEGKEDAFLQFRENAEKWSALECMDHLNRYDDHYLPIISKAVKRYPVKKGTFKYSWLGKKFVKMMDPKDSKPIKAMKNMNPSLSEVDPKTADNYRSHLEEMRHLLNQLKTANLNRRCVPTTMSSLMVMKLGDAVHFLLMHLVHVPSRN